MPLPTYAKKDEIPKGFEELYDEQDGKWVPKIDAIDDTKNLKSSLEKLKSDKKEAKEAREKAETELADLKRQMQALETGEEKDKLKKLLEKFDNDLKAAKKPLEDQVAELSGKLRAIQLDDKAKEAFIKAGGRPERADAALKLYKDSLDLAEDRIVVKNEKGEATTQSVEDFWGRKVRTDTPEFFKGTQANGGGAGGGAGKKGVQTTGKWDADAVIADPLGALKHANETAEAAA
jgi:uncharacterized UPF0160 family protein